MQKLSRKNLRHDSNSDLYFNNVFIPLPNIYLAILPKKRFYNTCIILSSTAFITRHIIAISQENLVYRSLFSFIFLAFLQSAKLPTDVFLPFVLPHSIIFFSGASSLLHYYTCTFVSKQQQLVKQRPCINQVAFFHFSPIQVQCCVKRDGILLLHRRVYATQLKTC